MKTLPIGVSSFESIINNDIYVDKTEHIYHLIKGNGSKRYFLSRPRRFGKSLTCSTLEAIFNGKKELFKELWIGSSDYEWKTRPVVYFDFSQISHDNPELLIRGLHSTIDSHAKKYNILLTKIDLKEKLAELITILGQTIAPIVMIIDEYDKPLVDNIEHLEVVEALRNQLKNFYGTLKSNDVDANLHFLFVTGVSKFSKVALFSDLNNLDDLTNDEQAAALVGYTDNEVDHYLTEHIQALAHKIKASYPKTRLMIKKWYNGYRFADGDITVYNPFSLHNCLKKSALKNYWFTSGTPSFLIKFIQKNPAIASDIEMIDGSFLAESNLDSFTIDLYYQNYVVLLLQTGYLTFLSDYDSDTNGYIIGYPNREVRFSMIEQIIHYVGGIHPNQFNQFGDRFNKALVADDLYLFCKHLQDFIKLIPHNIRVDRERFYQQTFFMICTLFGKRAVTEVATEEGFMDLLLEGTTKTFVVEFKKNSTPEIALAQIEQKRYWEPYEIIKTKQIVLAGITFNKSDAGVDVLCVTKAL